MRNTALAGLPLVLAAGYFAFKWLLAGPINAERLVALGGMYHWSALTLLALGWSVWMIRRNGSTQSFWGDFKQLTKPLAVYAILAACSVWGWNHVVAKDATELRKALRLAQIEEHTASEEAYAAFVAEQGLESVGELPDRETYQTQATTQVSWMLSGGVTFVLSLITYLFAAMLLSLCATVLLHQIWGIASL
tara:strand:+ start:1294 stop:1869 length:576 start_codon:yes stop_codon:yes gene_type:complete